MSSHDAYRYYRKRLSPSPSPYRLSQDQYIVKVLIPYGTDSSVDLSIFRTSVRLLATAFAGMVSHPSMLSAFHGALLCPRYCWLSPSFPRPSVARHRSGCPATGFFTKSFSWKNCRHLSTMTQAQLSCTFTLQRSPNPSRICLLGSLQFIPTFPTLRRGGRIRL